MKIPEGWPTAEMIRAGMNAPTKGHPETGGSSIVDIFTAMYEAAPTRPAQSNVWPHECEELCKSAEQFQRAVGELWKAENPDELQDGDTAMSEEEARELHSERWESLESAVYYMRKRMATPPAQNAEAIADTDIVSAALGNFAADPTGDNALAVVRAVMAAMPAQEDEPVAWMHDQPGRLDIAHTAAKDLWIRISAKQVEHYTIPLYTRLQSDSLRKAAEEVSKFLSEHLMDGPTGTYYMMRLLNAALEGKS